MAIVGTSGSLRSKSERDQPRDLPSELTDNRIELDGRALNNDRVIRETYLNNTAFDGDSFDSNKSLVAGYIQGQILHVTYFSQNTPPTDIQSQQVDLITGMSEDTHLSLTQIRNFELRIQSELSYSFDDEENISSVESSAATWPGFEPKVGDTFFYELRNGNIGVFVIGSVQRAVLGQETYHIVTFTLQQFVDNVIRDKYSKATTDVYYFDKKKFLVGSTSYLTSTDYELKKELTCLRPAIVHRFVDEYYDRSVNSFMRPDGIYDPYIVEYWKRKVNISDSDGVRPIQLLVNVDNYKRTIWSLMTGSPIKSFDNLDKTYTTQVKVGTYWDASITALVGNRYLTVGDERSSVESSYARTTQYSNIYPPAPVRPEQTDLDKQRFDEIADRLEQQVNATKPVVKPSHNYPAPYPILTNAQLRSVWKKINGIPQDSRLSDTDMARAAGYISWYRDRYAGTLSRYELEALWRKHEKVTASRLNRDQQLALAKYIREYRSRYPAVQTDEEIITIYEIHHKFEDYTESDIGTALQTYRRNHGYIPDDSYSDGNAEPNSIITLGEELHPLFTDYTAAEVEPDDAPQPPSSDSGCSCAKESYYALSSGFYHNGSMDGVEQVIRDTIDGKVSPSSILDVCRVVLEGQMSHRSPDVRLDYFYKLAMCIYLIDRALKHLMQS